MGWMWTSEMFPTPATRMAKAMPKVRPPMMSMVSMARVMPDVVKRFSTSLAALTEGKPGMRKMVHATSVYHIVPRPSAAGIAHAKMVATKPVIMAQA